METTQEKIQKLTKLKDITKDVKLKQALDVKIKALESDKDILK